MKENTFEKMQLPQDPIFIVGYPRSGTTLLQALLATQAGILSLPETHFFCTVNRFVKTDKKGFIELNCLEQVFEKIYEKMDLRFRPTEIEELTFYTKIKKLKPKNLFEYIVYYYIKKETAKKNNPWRWLEKTPNHAFFLGLIFSFYPEARFINIIRHPVPAVYSRKTSFPYSKDKTLDWLAQRWKLNVEKTEAFARENPGKLYSLKYEDLTDHLENELKKIGGFLKMNMNMALVKNHPGFARCFILPTEVWKKKDNRRHISNTNDKYKSLISREEAKGIESTLSNKMKEYGYSPFFN